MSIMTNVVLKEPCIDYLNAFENQYDYNAISTDSCKILDLDLVHMKKEDVNFSGTYNLRMKHDAKIGAIISWFDCIFEDL